MATATAIRLRRTTAACLVSPRPSSSPPGCRALAIARGDAAAPIVVVVATGCRNCLCTRREPAAYRYHQTSTKETNAVPVPTEHSARTVTRSPLLKMLQLLPPWSPQPSPRPPDLTRTLLHAPPPHGHRSLRLPRHHTPSSAGDMRLTFLISSDTCRAPSPPTTHANDAIAPKRDPAGASSSP